MLRYQILFLLLISLAGCKSVYKSLQRIEGDTRKIEKFKPQFASTVYFTTVDVTGHHLNGLLYIKKMPDSSSRIVFTNGAGPTFFDFGFLPNGDFKVYSILKMIDKGPVIKTLRKDFELMLMTTLNYSSGYVQQEGNLKYFTFPQSSGFYHYITDSQTQKLVRMERASKRKPVVVGIMQNYEAGVPDTIGFSHNKFNFEIALKKLKD